MNYYNIYTLILPVMMELTWSVFKHQTADVKQDISAHVTTFAAYLGEQRSNKIVNLFLNPLSVFSLLLLVLLATYNIPYLKGPLAVVFVVTSIGILLAFFAERRGAITTYITSTDPPYIMFLNLSYKFLLLPVLAYGVLYLIPAYYPMIIFLIATLGYHVYEYSKFARKVLR